MKAEPLKNKAIDMKDAYDVAMFPEEYEIIEGERYAFTEKDVKSAVEWLMGEIDHKAEEDWTPDDYFELIEKAFADVMKDT
jgi:hypothetical protein